MKGLEVGLVVSIFVLFLVLVVALTLLQSWKESTWPIARARIREAFSDFSATPQRTLTEWLPSPETLTKPSKCDSDGPAEYSSEGKGPYTSYDLLDDSMKPKMEPRLAVGPTSESCYKRDYSRTLELSSYSQRTNNYRHSYPDSCSAPNHDLILDFYKPNPIKA